MIPAAVVCSVTNDALSDVLPAVHAAGMGATARVVRPGRIPAIEQLRRIGVRIAEAPARLEDAAALIVVLAAGRSRTVASIVHRHGASATWMVGLRGEWEVYDDGLIPLRTDDVIAAFDLPIANVDQVADH